MKKSVLFFMLVSGLSFSQKNLKISDLQPKTEDSTFPVVSYAENPLVENKINTFLQVNELEYIPNSGSNPFKLVSTGTTSYANYVYFYSWKKLETPKNILSIGMDGEASGAYPEAFSDWKNFDLRTGNFINVQDLFQANSIKSLEHLLGQKVKKRVNDFLAELKSEKNPPVETEEQIGLYEGCSTEQSLDDIRYFFGKDKLTFVAGRCSNHAMRALDDLGSHEIELTYKELEKYWSPYARNLLSGSDKMEKTSFKNKLYKGKIDGKYPITVLVSRFYPADDSSGMSSFNAEYWYDKNKKLIKWDGQMKGNHISITENDHYNEETRQWVPRAFVEAEINGNKISGTWQDYKTKKNLSIELEEL
ncbi:hypothetical protein [Chryseobacterium jejuense]|uniref:Protein of uncharacterized function (DUF3298) n=1 Tax=Chryseobacterium jejuense TaxID=445960 RepID=A0A2X2XDF9_CHRJE|nr:hypothetical protein [Chryseobacterium jejuense]SDJ43707.1 hypothetical protein SAMN05421542_3556 [Chryseobacterium jejuense]SQB46055.1 Protein of uncharacterised function (DUF3298) [Chryseobacterium jejuense]